MPPASSPPPTASLAEILRVAAAGPFDAPGVTPQERLDAFAADSHGALPACQLRVVRVDDDPLSGPGAQVVRARQLIDGFPVDGHGLVLALSERGVEHVRGYFVRAAGFAAPSVTREQAIAIAAAHSGLSDRLAASAPADVPANAQGLQLATGEPPAFVEAPAQVSADTVIRVVAARAHLAWKVLIDTMLDKPVVYVDAYDGSVIWDTNLVRYYTTGKGRLRLVDGASTQRIETFGVTEATSTTHRLYSIQEGSVVWTLNAYFCAGGGQLCASEVTSSSSTDCGAINCADFQSVDARFINSHEHLENVIAFLKSKGLTSYDGNGSRIRSFTLRDGAGFDNAFFGGTDYVVLGDGSYRGGTSGYFQPFVASEVIFHEMGHAVDVHAGPNFEYEGESGALSESWADMQAFAGRAWVDGTHAVAHAFGADCVPGDFHVQEACGQSDLLPASDDCGACLANTQCGDGVCADVETCQGSGRGAECAADCGACTASAVAGDGVCNHGQGVAGELADGWMRNLVDPKQSAQPDTYAREYWQNAECGPPSNANDHCGVHTNSGVGNKWFTLLARGGSGRNDLGGDYALEGIGASAAYDVALRALRFKATATDRYQDFAESTVLAASELEAAGKLPRGVAQAASEAWEAVGIGARVGCDGPAACDDGDACTTDVCSGDPGTCSHGSVGCSDGDACNGVETCDPVLGCRPGAGTSCSDGSACTLDACNPSDGSCYITSTGQGLDTGIACSSNSQCCSGRCRLKRCR